MEQPQIGATTEGREEAFLPIPVDAKDGYGTSQSSSLLPSQVPFEARGPNTDSSMDMLTEDQVKSESGPEGHHTPCLVNSGWFSGKHMLPQTMEPRPSGTSLAERPQVASVVHRTSPGSTHSPTHSPCALPLAECKEGLVCNGAPETENKALDQPPGLSTLQKHATPQRALHQWRGWQEQGLTEPPAVCYKLWLCPLTLEELAPQVAAQPLGEAIYNGQP